MGCALSGCGPARSGPERLPEALVVGSHALPILQRHTELRFGHYQCIERFGE
jgi:hypothetical protein